MTDRLEGGVANELALFAGAGGGILGSHLLRWRTVCAVEVEPYRREILLRRQRDGLLSMFPIWDDVRTFDGRPWRGIVDVVTAGFPCQPFSCAGKRAGADDERNLWPETIRIIGEVGPRYALLENVPGLFATDYFGQILGDLAEAGYDARWDIVSAAETGAPHRRERLWILADAGQQLRQEIWTASATDKSTSNVHDQRRCADVADAASQQGRRLFQPRIQSDTRNSDWWAAEPDVGRVANRLAARVDRLAAIGDGQVPAVVVKAWDLLTHDRPA